MTVAELRAALADLDDEAPVLIDTEPWPLPVVAIDNVMISAGPGQMVRTIALTPERLDDYA